MKLEPVDKGYVCDITKSIEEFLEISDVYIKMERNRVLHIHNAEDKEIGMIIMFSHRVSVIYAEKDVHRIIESFAGRFIEIEEELE